MWNPFVMATGAKVSIPTYDKLIWPTVRALRELGSSATIREIVEKVTELERFSDEQLSVFHKNGPDTQIEYRLAWARTYLKKYGAVVNSRRGVWSLTEKGRALTPEEANTIPAFVRKEGRGRNGATEDGEPSDEASDWRQELLNRLLKMPPDAFERLAMRLLREAGFANLSVTGRSGDGGIDGVGVLQVSLISFPVVFQCKRWQGSVGSSTIRDFRGAMSGRSDKGLVITTSTFTAEAKREATRDGVAAIELIDGERLCDLLKDHALGVRTEAVEQSTIEGDFFDGL
jgi:restriction system protein